MQIIEITSLSGHSPYDITICDITKTYCYVVAIGVVSAPTTVEIPTELSGTQEVIVVITDSSGCETFSNYNCFTPTPTPTFTPTPTITPTNISCNCITFTNTGTTLGAFSYIDCDNQEINFKINSGTTLYVCGKSPSIIIGDVTYSMGLPCVNNTCVLPTPTPTVTPTIGASPTSTPTPTLTPTIGCMTPVLSSVIQLSGSTYGFIFSNSYGCTSIDIEYSRDTVTWTADTGTCSTSRIVNTGDGSGTWYFRIIQLCGGNYLTGNTLTYIPTSPNPTPTVTPTPTYPYQNLGYTYIVPEPQDATSLSNLSAYMTSSGSTFLGWGNSGLPSTVGYSNNLDIYIHYSGFTGGSGNFISNVNNLKSSNNSDSFGCTSIGIFNTIEITPTNVNPNLQYFYTIWVPIIIPFPPINNMLVNIGYSGPCTSSILNNGIPDSVLFSQDVFVTPDAVLPSGYYKVLWLDPSCLLPTISPPPSLSFPLYFKGAGII